MSKRRCSRCLDFDRYPKIEREDGIHEGNGFCHHIGESVYEWEDNPCGEFADRLSNPPMLARKEDDEVSK